MPNLNPVLSELEKYLGKKENKIGNVSFGYPRGQ